MGDISKIQIGATQFNVKDITARKAISDLEVLVQQGGLSTDEIKNIIKYGISDISGKTEEQLANLEKYGVEDISELSADELAQLEKNKLKALGLHKVASTGSYDDLENKPNVLNSSDVTKLINNELYGSYTKPDGAETVTTKNLTETLSGYQEKITDISTIRNGASAGATALQPKDVSSWAKAGSNETIPAAKLPSYVDDVIEGSLSTFPSAGETGKIYVDVNTNKTYRWTGSTYVEISPTIGPTVTNGTDDLAWNTNVTVGTINGTAITAKMPAKPSYTKADVGLGNVDNKSAATLKSEIMTAANVKSALGTGNGTSKYLREDGTWVTPPDTNTTYSSKAAANGGTDVSLVTTGEKYNWNNKTSNTGTVTKITAGTGLTGGDITTSGTIALATSGVTAGTYKRVTVDAYGRVTSGDNTDSDTHYTTGMYIGATNVKSNAAVTSPYIKLYDNDTKRSLFRIVGGGATTVKSDANGNITISSTDTNTQAVSSVVGNTGAVTAAQIATALTDAGYKLTDTNTNTDTLVTQTATTANANYEILFSNTADNTTRTEAARKNNNLLFNPSTGNLQVTQINGVTVGSSPKFTDTNTDTKYSAGTGLSLSNTTFSLATSGVTAGTYKRVTVDAYGRVTAGDNTDANDNNAVTQTATSTNADYEVLFSATADNTTRTEGARKYSNFKFNPSTGNLQVTKINGVDVGSSPKFTDTNTNTTYSAGTGLALRGTTFSVSYGTAAGTACQGNDSRLSNSRPASDVYSWAKASSKPSYAYSEIGYAVNATSSAGGTLSLAGTTPLHVVTLTGNVSALTLSANPAAGHSCHVILTGTASYTVAIAHDATNRVCPEAKDISLTVPANGYVEIDFLTANGKVYVRGV